MSSSPVVDEDEEVEVRGLLNRHQKRLLIDLEGSNMLTVLVKNGVISVITEALLNNFRSDAEDQRRKCDLLIDTIAKCGLTKFQQFCYAIEQECPELIHEMINDQVPCQPKGEDLPIGGNCKDGRERNALWSLF